MAEFTPKKSKFCKKVIWIYGGLSPICWRNFRRWWHCKRIRLRSVSDGAADREASGHGVQRLPAGLGCNPNKHFCGAKMASVATLALLAVSASPGNPAKKARGVFPTLPAFHMAISS